MKGKNEPDRVSDDDYDDEVDWDNPTDEDGNEVNNTDASLEYRKRLASKRELN